ncbi:MAG TPA: type IV toxin-antitoxin system AbiEi family antitoxin [Ilumatobacter sp.]|nr:type IV toxin-antitoxin system AbiEi family antitoxin [Ilumatobacter sp.]
MKVASLRPAELSDWLVAHGRHFVTNDEIAELVGVRASEVRHSLRRQREANAIVPVTKGAWVPVPPPYRRNGAPPVEHFIDPLMGFLGHYYYIGFLSAAALHGASHQAPMVFQVVTDAMLRDRPIGRQQVAFIRRAETRRRATIRRAVPTGRVNISTPEVTILDLCEAPLQGGGLSNVATVTASLLDSELIDSTALAEQAARYPVAVTQRVGYLAEQMGSAVDRPLDLDPLCALVAGAAPVELYPSAARSGERDGRWNVTVNIEIEPDL